MSSETARTTLSSRTAASEKDGTWSIASTVLRPQKPYCRLCKSGLSPLRCWTRRSAIIRPKSFPSSSIKHWPLARRDIDICPLCGRGPIWVSSKLGEDAALEAAREMPQPAFQYLIGQDPDSAGDNYDNLLQSSLLFISDVTSKEKIKIFAKYI